MHKWRKKEHKHNCQRLFFVLPILFFKVTLPLVLYTQLNSELSTHPVKVIYVNVFTGKQGSNLVRKFTICQSTHLLDHNLFYDQNQNELDSTKRRSIPYSFTCMCTVYFDIQENWNLFETHSQHIFKKIVHNKAALLFD